MGRLTDAELEELESLMQGAWRAPWTARRFEIDCPCPNGEDCGDSHTCDEVEAREAYPASPEAPAPEGRGQCVVQILVPGLESLAAPNARAIAAMRNAMPALLAEIREQRAELASLRAGLEQAARVVEAAAGAMEEEVPPPAHCAGYSMSTNSDRSLWICSRAGCRHAVARNAEGEWLLAALGLRTD